MRRHGITLAGFLITFLALAGCNTGTPATGPRQTPNPANDALVRAARAGHADTVKELLQSSVTNVETRDEAGNTALIEAAHNGHNDVVRALLIARADVRARNLNGKTALMLASEGGHSETIQLLKQAGATE